MSLNYSIIETFKLLELAIKNDMFITITVCSIILTIIFLINKDRSFVKYAVLILNILFIMLILYYYRSNLLTFSINDFMNNIYFYFFNSIIYLIISIVVTFKTKYKNTNYIIYLLVLINLSYSLFITHYFHNTTLIVIGNIFPMIKFGNIIYIVYYIIILCVIIYKNLYNSLYKRT